MTKSMKSLMMGAALAGLMAGNTAMAQTPSSSQIRFPATRTMGHSATSFDKDKHACKGQNSCKGKGGCKTGDNGCKGKNSCKGKGGCATDGSKPPFSVINRPQGPEHVRALRVPQEPVRHVAAPRLMFAPREASILRICPQIASTGLPNTASGSVCAFRTTTTSWSRSRSCDWFEIISENFMVDGGRPLYVLDQILEQYRVVQHGVSMYFGSAEPLNREHLRRLKGAGAAHEDTMALRSSVLGQRGWHILARPAADAIHVRGGEKTAQKIREARDFLEVPVVVENVSSYAEFHVSEMTEWEFLTEVVERADCGILLDVNNIYVSSQNHGFDPFEYLDSVPHDRVAQIHIAGHSKYEKYMLDTHDHPVIDPVWKLYARAIELIGPTATLLEWDDHIPSFEEVHGEALKAKRYRA